MKLVERSFEDLGITIDNQNHRDISRLAMKEVEDTDPTIEHLQKDGRQFVLVAHGLEGHGTYSLFEVEEERMATREEQILQGLILSIKATVKTRRERRGILFFDFCVCDHGNIQDMIKDSVERARLQGIEGHVQSDNSGSVAITSDESPLSESDWDWLLEEENLCDISLYWEYEHFLAVLPLLSALGLGQMAIVTALGVYGKGETQILADIRTRGNLP